MCINPLGERSSSVMELITINALYAKGSKNNGTFLSSLFQPTESPNFVPSSNREQVEGVMGGQNYPDIGYSILVTPRAIFLFFLSF